MKRLFAGRKTGLWLLVALGLAITVILVFAAPWASKSPDSIEKFAMDKGLSSKTANGAAPVKDYKVPGVTSESASTRVAGIIGVAATLLAVLAISFVALRLGKRKKSVDLPPGEGSANEA